MFLERVELERFRVYPSLALDLDPGLNVFVGPNASGKSSLLEAVSVLAFGRSFRGAADAEMARAGQDGYLVGGRFVGARGRHRVMVSFAKAEADLPARKIVSVDGHTLARAADILGRVPLLTFSPDDLALAKGGPSERRRFLDLLLGQMSPVYRDDLSRYARAVAQRNALLADLAGRRTSLRAAAALLEPWDESVGAGAEAVQRSRAAAAEALAPRVAKTFAEVDGGVVELVYAPDRFDPGRRQEELRRGTTLSGPHRDELLATIDGQDSRRFASQGQQRSLVLALKLAALDLLREESGETPVLLLDDALSELDPRRSARLLPLLLSGQALVTATDRAALRRVLGRVFSGGAGEARPVGEVGTWFAVRRATPSGAGQVSPEPLDAREEEES